MHPLQAQELVRELITATDHLSRTSHRAGEDRQSARLSALLGTLARLERRIGATPHPFALRGELDVVYQRIRDVASGMTDARGGDGAVRLVAAAERLRERRPSRATLRRRAGSRRAGAAALGLVSVIALVVPKLAPGVRRSRLGRGVAAAAALASMAAAALLVARPGRLRVPLAWWLPLTPTRRA